MKHYLNFKPTIVFRKGSSFMLKTSLVILYAAPLALAFFWSYQYFALSSINKFYVESEKALRSRTSAFNETIARLRPVTEELPANEKQYFDYRKVAAVSRTSWSKLLSVLENLVPADLRFKKISIRPEKLVKVSIEGEAMDLAQITQLLQSLFKETEFINPDLRKHRRVVTGGKEVVNFTLEVDYAGESGELP